MTELLSAIGGLAVGIIGTTLYLGKEIKELRPKDKDIPLSKAKMMLKGFIA